MNNPESARFSPLALAIAGAFVFIKTTIMAKPVILCHYSGKVNEIADYKRGGLKWAQISLRLHADNMRKHNALIVAKGGKPGDDFFFINQTIKRNVQVITISDKDVFETNEPAILKMLEGYIEVPDINNKLDQLR